MKKSQLTQIIKEELKSIRKEAHIKSTFTYDKVIGGITKHFSDYKGTETYNSIQELEDILMYYAQDPRQPLDLDEIADTVIDIIDYAMQDARDDMNQSR